jgi:tRNA(fMet)-specific endonuclease VapC
MRYMLDTDICIYAINERPPKVLRALRQFQPAGLGISSVTAAELYYGVARTGSQRNLDALQRFLDAMEIAPFDTSAAQVCGPLRAWLTSQGTPIGPYDTLIAAHAHALGAGQQQHA